jgi:hypothetical protein
MMIVSVLVEIQSSYSIEQYKALLFSFYSSNDISKCLLDFCSFLTLLRFLTQTKIYIFRSRDMNSSYIVSSRIGIDITYYIDRSRESIKSDVINHIR